MHLFRTFPMAVLFAVLACTSLPQGNVASAQESAGGAAEAQAATPVVSWVFEVAIKEGEAEPLRALIREMSDRAEANEAGTLVYEWAISEDGTRGRVYERYRDSEAALIHLASFNENFADRLMALVDPTEFVVYGNPSAALKQELAGADPVYMLRAGGFTR